MIQEVLRWMLRDHAGSTAASPMLDSRVASAERLSVIGIVSGLHRHDDNSWFVPSFPSGHTVVTLCVDVSQTCAVSRGPRHTTSMVHQRVFHDVLSNFADGRCHACSSVDASDGKCLDGCQQ